METKTKKTSKVAHQLPKVAWRDSAIDKLSVHGLKGRLDVRCAVTGNLTGTYIRWNTKSNRKTFIIKGKVGSKVFTHTIGVFQPGSFGVFEAEKYVNDLVTENKLKDRTGVWIKNPNEENVDVFFVFVSIPT